MSLQRREFFAILGACTVGAERLFAQHEHALDGGGPDFTAYQPKAFTTSEYKLLDELLESLLPADETGPGAHDAHVAYYIDVVLSHASGGALQSWRNGLGKVEQLANDRFRQPFGACSVPQRQEVLATLAKNEMAPVADIDHFFVEFKRRAIDGFYASELIQREHLGYRGNTAIAEFPGCTHPNFEHPDIA
jgi:Gluconate 2-dehydrogenase subunit 3